MTVLAPEQTSRPKPRPFLAAAKQFTDGTSTPRDFLEACLVEFANREKEVGAFVRFDIEGARAAADTSTARWKAGKPASAIDGMPMGIKDIIETVDMPTEMGSPLFAGWRSEKDAACVSALRQAGAVILGKTVTTEFAATEPRGTRNPYNLEHTPGGSSSGSAAAVGCGMVSGALGTQVIGSVIRPASYCGTYGFKPSVNALNREGCHDYQSQSCTGIIAATLEDTWQVAHEIVSRVGGDAGTPGLIGSDTCPAPAKPKRLVFLETAGWPNAEPAAKKLMQDALNTLKSAGIAIATRHDDAKIAAVESNIVDAHPLSNKINSFEGRWFLRGARDRDAEKLSKIMQTRLAEAETITLADHRAALIERARIRALYAELAGTCDGCITLAATGGAPKGLQSTGNAQFAVPSSLLGVPALTLPLFDIDGMPLGLQVLGFFNEDAKAFAISGWLCDQLMSL
ncbi:MAG TPA: amidase [Xanthobacteraceae bacterium]|nr:amidase [Xanthobacteraceae bacterium]